MQETFNQLPYISVHEGPHGYPVVHMEHPNGSDLTLHLHGGFISSWVDVGKELLFVHPGTDFKPSRPLTCASVRPLPCGLPAVLCNTACIGGVYLHGS